MEKVNEFSKLSPVPTAENQNDNRSSVCCFDRRTLRYKFHYFLIFGAKGSIVPFLMIIATNRIGLSCTSLGAMLAAQKFIEILTSVLTGYIADYFNKLKIMISVFLVIFMASVFFMYAISSIRAAEDDPLKVQDFHCQLHEILLNESIQYSESICNDINDIKYSNRSLKYAVSKLNQSVMETLDLFSTDHPLKNLKKSESVGYISENKNATQKVGETLAQKLYTMHGYQTLNNNKSLQDYIETVELEDIIDKRTQVPDGKNRKEMEKRRLFLLCYANNIEVPHAYGIVLCETPKVGSKRAESRNDFVTYQFWIFSMLFFIASISLSNTVRLTDTAVSESMKEMGSQYGKQRMFGAIGWGSMSIVGGLLNDLNGDLMTSSSVMVVLGLIAIWNIYFLDLNKPQFSKDLLKNIGKVLRSNEFLTFQLGVFMCGYGITLMWHFFGLYLTFLGGSRLLVGTAEGVQNFCEIPFMFFSDLIIKRVGHFNVLSLSLACFSIRFLFYSYLINPWLTLPIELLNGITFGLVYTNLVSFATSISLPGTEATAIMITFSTWIGLGGGVSSVVFGIGMDHFGFRKMYFYTSIFFAVGMMIVIVLNLLLKINRKKPSELKEHYPN